MTRLPLPTLVLGGFALAQLPLAAIANALDWIAYVPTGDGQLRDIALHGSAISGPLTPQLPFLLIALLAARRGRAGLAGCWLALAAGLVIFGNSIASFFNDDPVATPQAVLTIAATGFVLAGAAVLGSAARELLLRLAPARAPGPAALSGETSR